MHAGVMRILGIALLATLAACKSQQPVTVYSGHPLPEPTVVAEPQSPVVEPAVVNKQRVLIDMLYEARQAYDDNRLMQPAGRNAYDLYLQALQLDPDNTIARDGIEEIATRYLMMADTSIGQGSYENADNYLARAARLSPNRSELAIARARLAESKKGQGDVRNLNPAALAAKSPAVKKELADIAKQLQKSGGTFLIRARNDEEGRWIYQVMREAVGGYRLRGSIDISPTPAIVLALPPGGANPAAKTLRN